MSRFDVVVVGSANLDLVVTTTRRPNEGETVLGSSFAEHPGGKGLNQAVAAARAGATVALLGALGTDEAGRSLRSVAVAEGVDVTGLATVSDAPTGRALIVVDEHAENSIVVVPGANGRVAIDALPPAAVVLAQLEVPLDTVADALSLARAAGSTTVLDPAPVRDLPDDLLERCDVVVPNEHEVDLLGGVDRLIAAGVGAVIVTRGGAGVTVHERDGSAWSIDPFDVDPIDTTGAGDAFCGALVSRLAAGDALRSAVRYAAAAGALATTRPGAVPSLPHASAIDGLLGR